MHVLPLLLLPLSASAHFILDYPAARGPFDEDLLPTFPCATHDTPSSNRTLWPLDGSGVVALTMGHVTANVEVLLGLGGDPGVAFNTVLRPTFAETGLGSFCITGLAIPPGLNLTDGMNATIQVVTNGDPNGGLYNCADITFSSSAPIPAPGVCTNGTGVTASTATIAGSPNGTTSTESSPAATTSKSAAVASREMTAGLAVMVGVAAALVL